MRQYQPSKKHVCIERITTNYHWLPITIERYLKSVMTRQQLAPNVMKRRDMYV